MRRSTALVVICAFVVGCGGVDKQKFDAVQKAGAALQSEVQSGSSAPTSPARDRLKQFDAEINALRDRVIGKQEGIALQDYADAADAYRYFLRFRAVDTEEGTGQIVLKGPNLEVATRYKLPIDSKGGVKSVDRARAITILLQAAEQHLSDGDRVVNGR